MKCAIRAVTASLFFLCCLAATAAEPTVPGVPQWRINPSKSQLGFTASQAGAEFQGKFEKFSADIRFDPKNLAQSRFDVTVDMASAKTGDGERDDALRGQDFFWAQRSPQARYVATHFTSQGNGKFLANGKLTMRDVTRDVPISFTFDQKGQTATLKGSGGLKRLDFRVGVGEWESTEWIRNDVKINFTLDLTR